MKQLLILSVAILFSAEKGFTQTKGFADRKTGQYVLVGNLTAHYHIFGYALPDENSQKVILFSMPPSGEKNPTVYKLGSYNETTNLKLGEKIKYIGKKGKFAEMSFIYSDNTTSIFYLNEKYVDTN